MSRWHIGMFGTSLVLLVVVCWRVYDERRTALEHSRSTPYVEAAMPPPVLDTSAWTDLKDGLAPTTATATCSFANGAASDCTLSVDALARHTGDVLTLRNVSVTELDLCLGHPLKLVVLRGVTAATVKASRCSSMMELQVIDSIIGTLDLSGSSLEQGVAVSGSRITSFNGRRAKLGAVTFSRNPSIGMIDLFHGHVADDVALLGMVPEATMKTWPRRCRGAPNGCAIAALPPDAVQMTVVDALEAEGLEAQNLEIHGARVRGRTSGKAMRVAVIDTRFSYFKGPVSFSFVHATHIEASSTWFDGGLELFGLELSGNLDLAFSTVKKYLYALDGEAHIVQLASTTLADPDEANPVGDVPWLLSMRAADMQLDDLRVEESPLALRYVSNVAIDIRSVKGPIDLHGGSFTAFTLDPDEPVHPDSDLTAVTIADMRVGSNCALGWTFACASGPTHVVDKISDVKRWLLHGPKGASDVLRATSAMTRNLRLARECYLASVWSSGHASIPFVLTGDGRRPGWWYVLGLVGLFLLVVATFWNRPANWDDAKNRWLWHRWVFAAGVLLPSVIDIGVTVKDDKGYYWNDAPALTFLFHLYHALGWFMLTLIAYVVSRSFT